VEKDMAFQVEHLPSRTKRVSDQVYSPDILSLLQSLLADLADINFAYEKSLEAIRRSPADDKLKGEMIDKLRQRHRERQAPYIRELTALQDQIWAGRALS
jgi:hypothetical protein